MDMSPTAVSAMNSATTPEEAYKVFADVVSKGLTDLMAEALAKAVGAASVSATNSNIAGWQNYVGGIALDMVWGSAGMKAAPTVKLHFANGLVPAGAHPTIAGGSITIGGTWTF